MIDADELINEHKLTDTIEHDTQKSHLYIGSYD